MTTAERVKATADYFNLELSDYDKQRLESIWMQEPKVIVKQIEVKQPVIVYKSFDNKEVEKKTPNAAYMLTLLQNIAEMYGCNYVRCFNKDRETKVVRAKVYFCRKMRYDFPEITSVELADFLKQDHSTILFYWYESKVDVPIQRFYYKKRKKIAA